MTTIGEVGIMETKEEIMPNAANLVDIGFVNRLTELPITNREKEVLVNLAQGITNK